MLDLIAYDPGCSTKPPPQWQCQWHFGSIFHNVPAKPEKIISNAPATRMMPKAPLGLVYQKQ